MRTFEDDYPSADPGATPRLILTRGEGWSVDRPDLIPAPFTHVCRECSAYTFGPVCGPCRI